jgi:hypothetical protein
VELTLVSAADPITAILDQLAGHAEKIGALDARHAGDMAAVTARLAALAARLDAELTGIARPGEHDADQSAEPYVPGPARRWWKLDGTDRAEAIAVLRAWVDQVYRPGYGQLAAALALCWEQHPLCLYALDILAELWSVLYLAGDRTPALLSAQAEYQARVLPALAEQMATETSRCRHGLDRPPPASHSVRSPR